STPARCATACARSSSPSARPRPSPTPPETALARSTRAQSSDSSYPGDVTSTPTTSSGATAPVDDAALDDAPVVAGELADEPHSGTTSSSGEQDGHEVDAASVTPARHLAPGPSEAETPAEPVPHRHRARHRRWILPAVLAVLLVGAIGSGVYLWRVAEAWIERDAQWQAHASDLAEELGTTKSELGDTMGELEVVRGQLDQAQARISELAD